MIDSFSIAKALLDNSQFIADAGGYTLIPNGESYTPDPNATYIEEFVLYGPDNAIGLADDSSDIQIGMYQINVNTPKSEDGSKWKGLKISNIFKAGFNRGKELIFNGQMVRIRNTSIIPMDMNETHETHILNISYSVIN